jgi:epoxyqueuosine reductase
MPAAAITPDEIKSLAAKLGFALCGIADARPTDHRQHFLDWLTAGRHGSMDYLADNVELRFDPCALVPGATSIICLADFLGPADSTPENPQSAIRDPQSGRIARYAQFNDYHTVIKKRLHKMADVLEAREPEHVFRCSVDTAPVLEREHAARAGLGWVAKNTLLIHPQLGSHLLLSQIITTLPLTPDPVPQPEAGHCGSCTRCIDACPTACITPYSVDASRCISYLTIENRGPIDPAFHPAIAEWLYGCDVCQEVCPFNAHPERAADIDIPEAYGQRPATMSLLEVLDWTEEDRRVAFTRSAMKRAKLDAMKRNALIVAGNRLREQSDSALYARLAQVVGDEAESPMVRDTARSVIASLGDAS